MPHRMNAAEIARYGISMTVGTIHNILSRTGKNMGTKALHIMESVRASDLLHVDETSFSLNGRNVWVWIFFNPRTGETLYVIRESRGKDVIREVLEATGRARLCVMDGPHTRVTIFRGAGPIYCARSETSCARTPAVRRQNRCCALSQMHTDAERMLKKYPNPGQKTWKHLSLGASCTSTCAGAYAESSKS